VKEILTHNFRSVLAVASASLIGAGSALADAPATIDVSHVPAQLVDNVIVPVPQEIFSSLDKLGSQDWDSQLKTGNFDKLGKRPQIALLFGVVVADGFVAVQAQDAKQVEKIGNHVLRISRALGVSNTVTSHAQAIIEASGKNDWHRIRQELDRIQEGVHQKMLELRDEELAQLMTIGGWLRGTEALTSILSTNYSIAGADILNQPDLVDHLNGQIGGMPLFTKGNGTVKSVREGLVKLQPLLRCSGGGSVPKATVAQIHGITSSLVAGIIANQN
jgi:hypothetical protein